GGADATAPLIPALSPRERENQSAPSGQNGTRTTETVRAISPEEEGQGEGDPGATKPHSSGPAGDLQGVFRVVLAASLEVRSAVVYASFIVALVFLPVLTMTGLHGRFFAPLGIAFILAILASLAVALTVTPALCFLMLSRARPHEEPGYLRRLKEVHRRALEKAGRHPRATIRPALALFAGALARL